MTALCCFFDNYLPRLPAPPPRDIPPPPRPEGLLTLPPPPKDDGRLVGRLGLEDGLLGLDVGRLGADGRPLPNPPPKPPLEGRGGRGGRCCGLPWFTMIIGRERRRGVLCTTGPAS